MLNLITYTEHSKFVAVSQLLSEEKIKNLVRHFILDGTSLLQQLKIKAFSETDISYFWHSWLPLSVFQFKTFSALPGHWSCCSWGQGRKVKQQHGFKILRLAFTGWASILLVVFPLLPSDGSFKNQSNQSTLLSTHVDNPEEHYCLATVKGCFNTSQNCICLRTTMKSLNWMAQDYKAEESIGLLTSDKDSVSYLHEDHTLC